MPLPDSLTRGLRVPAIAAPLFIISNPRSVLAQCKAGMIGSFPALNARPSSELDEWIAEIAEGLKNAAEAGTMPASYAVNQIVHKSNRRLDEDLAICVKYKVPIVISSMGAVAEVNAAVHSYGGIVLHDVINDRHARKAIANGADGLIAVAAGAGGHAGMLSPFAIIQEIRQWFDGPLLLSGAIASGRAILAAQVMGADLAYIGSPFIATDEAQADQAYKDMIVASKAADIIGTNVFTGVFGNYLRQSIINSGIDPDTLGAVRKLDTDVAADRNMRWKNIWGSGHGIGNVSSIEPARALIDRLSSEYAQARIDAMTKFGGQG